MSPRPQQGIGGAVAPDLDLRRAPDSGLIHVRVRNLCRWAMAGTSVLAMAIGAQAAPQQRMGAPVRLTLQRHAPAEIVCKDREPAFDTPVDTELVGGTSHAGRNGEATALTGWSAQAAPVAAESQGRLRLNGQKYASPVGARTEAGVGLSLGSHLSLQLNYARTASAPMMAYANDNGVLARLRIGF